MVLVGGDLCYSMFDLIHDMTSLIHGSDHGCTGRSDTGSGMCVRDVFYRIDPPPTPRLGIPHDTAPVPVPVPVTAPLRAAPKFRTTRDCTSRDQE